MDIVPKLGGDGGVIALDADGNFAMPFNTDGMYRGWVDRDFIACHTTGFEQLAESVKKYTPEYSAKIAGVPAEMIVRAAEIWGPAPTSFLLHARGIENHSKGVDNCIAAISLVVATGRIGIVATHRAYHGVNRLFVTRTDSGHDRVNISESLGNAVAAAISNVYHPAEDRTAARNASTFGFLILWDGLSNELKEFLPDIRRKVLHKETP